MDIVEYAKSELKIIGMLDSEDEMNKAMCDHLLHMCEEFAKEGHSGFSANYAINCLQKLLRWEPLSPLTGEDWEWNHVADNLWQNKRCSSVFKDETGKAHDIDGKVFWEWNTSFEDGKPYKSYYTNGGCHTPVTFPYSPPEKRIEEYRYSDATPKAPPQTEAGLL